MKDDQPRNRKRRPFHSEAGNIPIGPNISMKNKYLLGTGRKMIKNYIEIFISGSRNIYLLISTMKIKYFYSAVVLVATIFYSLQMYGVSNRGTSNLDILKTCCRG